MRNVFVYFLIDVILVVGFGCDMMLFCVLIVRVDVVWVLVGFFINNVFRLINLFLMIFCLIGWFIWYLMGIVIELIGLGVGWWVEVIMEVIFVFVYEDVRLELIGEMRLGIRVVDCCNVVIGGLKILLFVWFWVCCGGVVCCNSVVWCCGVVWGSWIVWGWGGVSWVWIFCLLLLVCWCWVLCWFGLCVCFGFWVLWVVVCLSCFFGFGIDFVDFVVF